MCPNPTCREGAFVANRDGNGPLLLKTLEEAFDMKQQLENRPAGKGFLSSLGVDFKEIGLPEFFECERCHTVFPCRGSSFFVVRKQADEPSVGSVDL
jgi:hypothetical protein